MLPKECAFIALNGSSALPISCRKDDSLTHGETHG